MLRPRLLIGFAVAVGVATTAAVVAVPSVGGAYRSISVHVGVETAASLIALLAAYLVFGRFQQNARLSDLTLFCALAIFGLTNLLFRALPAALSGTVNVGGFPLWAPLSGVVIGAFVFALAAFTHDVAVTRPTRYMVASLLLVLVSMTAVAAAAGVTHSLYEASALEPSGRPEFLGNPRVSAVQLLAALLFAVGALGFARRARGGDELIRWFAAGAILAAFSRLNAGLFPTPAVGSVHLGDLLRVGFYALVLIGAAREISGYWVKFAEAAILEERRRIARDLHDGLAQELAFIVSQAHRAERQNPGGLVEELSVVAQRALDDSRRAIAALVEPLDQPFAAMLARTAREIAERTGVAIRLELDDDTEVDSARREAMLRIVREAVMNAARHGHAHAITVRLSQEEGLHLEIADDGIGFDAAAARRDRFGLITMKERAQALGAEFRIDSEPGAGTKVEVVFP